MLDWSQWVLISALGAALALGRPGWRLSALMLTNCGATVLFADYPMSVAVVDAICGTVLVLTRWMPVGVLFALMVIVAVGGKTFDLPMATTYAIVDVLAYLQLFIIGGSGFGMVRRLPFARRPADGRGSDPMAGLAFGGTPRNRVSLSEIIK